jgi:hypothetical protein
MMASEEGVMMLAEEMSRYDVKPVGMAGPSIGNHLAMTTARTVIRPFCINILYHTLLLFINIFHI